MPAAQLMPTPPEPVTRGERRFPPPLPIKLPQLLPPEEGRSKPLSSELSSYFYKINIDRYE